MVGEHSKRSSVVPLAVNTERKSFCSYVCEDNAGHKIGATTLLMATSSANKVVWKTAKNNWSHFFWDKPAKPELFYRFLAHVSLQSKGVVISCLPYFVLY